MARASGADRTARLDALLDEIGKIEGVLKRHTSVLLALRLDRTGWPVKGLAVALVRAIIALHQNGPARSGLNWQAFLTVSSISCLKARYLLSPHASVLIDTD